MKQKIAVADLRLGMYVAELDRPWTAAPFEPPFDVQGFTMHTDEELEKVRELCEYVYIEVEPTVKAGAARPKRKHATVVERSGTSHMRYVSGGYQPVLEEQKNPEPRIRAAEEEPAPPEQSTASGGKRTSPIGFDIKVPREGKADPRPARGERTRGATGPRTRTVAYTYDANSPAARLQRARQKGLVSVYKAAMRGDHQRVYRDQTKVHEELVVARSVISDAEKTYANVMRDLREGRRIDKEEVDETVHALVHSVIRNPDALTWLIKLKHEDDDAYFHSLAVCVMALNVARHLGYPEEELKKVGMGTLLQDVGKIHIPAELLKKPGSLTPAEREIVNKHVAEAQKMLRSEKEYPGEVLDIVGSHHERYNGSGYPRGLSGSAISMFSTIAGLADTYEALVSDRPYRQALTSLDAMMKLYDLGDRLFPMVMVEQLIQCIGIFPIGSFVETNSGHIGVVVSRNRVHQLKPSLLLVTDPTKRRLAKLQPIDLAAQRSGDESRPWRIVKVVDAEEYGLNARDFFC